MYRSQNARCSRNRRVAPVGVDIGAQGTAIQTRPLPTATSRGDPPTWIVAATLFVAGLIRETVPSLAFTTHTAPAPTATAEGPLPTGIVRATEFGAGSIRHTAFSELTVTQTAP